MNQRGFRISEGCCLFMVLMEEFIMYIYEWQARVHPKQKGGYHRSKYDYTSCIAVTSGMYRRFQN